MLFAHPTSASAQACSATPIAEFGRVRELGFIFPSERTGALGTACRSVHFKTAVRPAFHGWLAGRRPVNFPAGRKRPLGTVPLSLFNSVVRAASGWLSARTPGDFPCGRTGALGTALLSVHSQTAVRPAFHGWLAGRLPLAFQAGRDGSLGTVPLSLFTSGVRAASGWLSARTPGDFPCGRTGALGTALLSVHSQTVVRPAFHGWFAGRLPLDFSGTMRPAVAGVA